MLLKIIYEWGGDIFLRYIQKPENIVRDSIVFGSTNEIGVNWKNGRRNGIWKNGISCSGLIILDPLLWALSHRAPVDLPEM